LIAAAADLTLVLFWASLGAGVVIVCLFLWLMREDRSESVRRQASGEAKPSTEPDEGPAA
jgi:hypothetical protein